MAFFATVGFVRRMFTSRVSVPVIEAGLQAGASDQKPALMQKLEGRAYFASAPAFSVVADPNAPIGPVFVAPANVEAQAVRTPQAALSASSFYDGINVNTSADASSIIPKLKQLGIKGVRIWVGMKTWSHRGNGSAFVQAKKYRDAGITVMMNIGVKESASESTYRGFFSWMKNQKYFSSVNMFQIGNEPNHYKSWNGGLDGYMKLLKVAWSELKPKGAKILGAGPTSDVNAVKQLVQKGYLNYVDYAGFHPYGHTPAQIIDKLKQAKAIYGSKPLIVSEWNVRSQQDGSQWANAVKAARKDMAKYCEGAYYFCLVEANTMAGPAGAYKTNWAKNGPYWDAVNSFQYMEGGSKR